MKVPNAIILLEKNEYLIIKIEKLTKENNLP